MHETSQQQRVNNSMSIDSSSTLGLSKLTLKKTTFYKHDDPSKLNYYARFSPKRKTLDEGFEQVILKGESPLSPKTSKASSSSKKSFKSVTKKVFQDQSRKLQKNNFELIVPNSLLSANKTNPRSEIYIDEDEESSSDEFHNDNFLHNANELISNNGLQNGFHHKTNFLEISIPQNPRQFSESQESSSFERMIEPSSSQDNDAPYVSVSKTSGGEMLIQDDESEPGSQQTLKKFDNQTPIKVIEGSQQKILELAKSIGAYKQNEIPKSVKSQNISFSVDSDLSFMEQNWNSYFQTTHDDENFNTEVSQRKIVSENLILQGINNQQILVQNDHNMSSSSDDELPSFSHPDTSNYYISPGQSRNPSTYSQDADHLMDLQTETEAKQFKRQFTFGNELNVEFEEKTSQVQPKTESKQPLFKKFLKKSVIENFKLKDFNKKQKDLNSTFKVKAPSILHEKPSTTEKNKLKKALSSHEKKTIVRNMNTPVIDLLKKEEEIQDQKIIFTQEFNRSQSKKGKEILIIEETGNEIKKNSIKKNVLKEFQTLDQNQEKQLEKVQNRVKWQNAPKSKVETQKKGRQASSSIKQKLEKSKQSIHNEIKIDENEEDEQKNCQTEYCRVSFDRTQKFVEENSYLKIFSEKKFHKIRKGSYNDRAKISENQYQSSEFEERSQNSNKFSQPKSQRCESMTTATQEVNQNSQIPPHYFLKNKQNCISQVENLKKYLQKIQIPQLKEKQKIPEKSNTFEIHENFSVYGSQKDGISESDQSICYEKIQNKEVQNQNQQLNSDRPQVTYKDDSSMNQTSNPIYPESYQPNTSMKLSENQSQIDTPIKQLKKESEIEEEALLQKKQKRNLIANNQVVKLRGFQKSLTVLEEMIRSESSELGRVYQKIYTQVYQQELKYQQRLDKQESLINVMESFIQARSKKIDGEKFLSQERSTSNELQHIPPEQDSNRVQILINKHMIFSLVRNIVSIRSKS